jgi:hypothetical protein
MRPCHATTMASRRGRKAANGLVTAEIDGTYAPTPPEPAAVIKSPAALSHATALAEGHDARSKPLSGLRSKFA